MDLERDWDLVDQTYLVAERDLPFLCPFVVGILSGRGIRNPFAACAELVDYGTYCTKHEAFLDDWLEKWYGRDQR